VTTAFEGTRPGPPLGYYTYTVSDDHWSWSDGIYALHGFEPGEMPATTDTLLRHQHPDDRTRACEVLETAVRSGRPFSCYHRIIDRHPRVRAVLSVGRGVRGHGGVVEQLVGFFVDLADLRQATGEPGIPAPALVTQNGAARKGAARSGAARGQSSAGALMLPRSRPSGLRKEGSGCL